MDLEKRDNIPKIKGFDSRQNFVWIGNFNHPPNIDAANVLVKEIWPRLRKRLPTAELHLYGSNFRKEFSGLEHEGNGIKSKVFSLYHY